MRDPMDVPEEKVVEALQVSRHEILGFVPKDLEPFLKRPTTAMPMHFCTHTGLTSTEHPNPELLARYPGCSHRFLYLGPIPLRHPIDVEIGEQHYHRRRWVCCGAAPLQSKSLIPSQQEIDATIRAIERLGCY
ncbi:hypothetical protein GWK47_049206 [Chionoecetes opilio]|uniref:Uncharacterized protein n=1 Tax=Chionoecetes opilio TaxID=41210 RepID=A0A8J4Y3C6_CHIOP|nr:hypothetical protein GWK47_049206 [Chionoecetes opilio]